jgi:hypothetical protein
MHEMLQRRWAKALAGIIVVFAIGLVGFYIFSAEYGDGLEATMECAGVEEAEPVYTGPLGYGDSYLGSLAMGAIGFFATLLAVYLLARWLRKNEA